MWLSFKKTIFNATIFKGEVNKAHACADVRVFTIQQVSVGSVTPERNWASQKFGWFPSESHPVGLSFGKKLYCLFAMKLAKSTASILFSNCMVHSFCCCHLWFGSSKIVLSTERINKTQKSGHLFTILCWGEVMPYPSSSLALLLLCQERL